MSFAEHLAIVQIGGAALAPGTDVVGLHVLEIPDFFFVGFPLQHAVRAVALVLGFGLFCLPVIENGFKL